MRCLHHGDPIKTQECKLPDATASQPGKTHSSKSKNPAIRFATQILVYRPPSNAPGPSPIGALPSDKKAGEARTRTARTIRINLYGHFLPTESMGFADAIDGDKRHDTAPTRRDAVGRGVPKSKKAGRAVQFSGTRTGLDARACGQAGVES